MEQNALYEQIDFTKRAYANYCVHANAYGRSSGTECGDVENKEAGTRAPAAPTCPSCPQTAAKGTQKDYCVNGGAELPERASTDGYAPIQANIDNQRGPFIGLFWANSGCGMQSIADGASHTFLAMELSSVTLPNATKVSDSANPFISVGRWSDGYGVFTHSGATDIPLNRLAYREDARAPRSFHVGGMNATLADGGVRFVSKTCNLHAYQATFSRAGAGGKHGQGGRNAGGGEALF